MTLADNIAKNNHSNSDMFSTFTKNRWLHVQYKCFSTEANELMGLIEQLGVLYLWRSVYIKIC